MLILASGSPRRAEILTMLGYSFVKDPADCDEDTGGMTAEQSVGVLAERKAMAAAARHPDDVVLGSDTLVTLDGAPIGKPRNADDAFDMLRLLSGKTHRVWTGVSVVRRGKAETIAACADVTFYPLTDEEIREYISTGEPLDKAGAYGIQGRGATLIDGINGDFFTVMGLPAAITARLLKKYGIYPDGHHPDGL